MVKLKFVLLLVVFAVTLVFAAALGAPVPVSDLFSHEAGRAAVARAIFLGLRPPRLAAAALVGAALASSGAALQAVFANPLAEPYLLGVSAGGGLGATVALALRLPGWGGFGAVNLLALLGALAAAAAVYSLGQPRPGGTRSPGAGHAGLLLVGVALSAFLSAIMALVVALSSRAELAQQAMFWLLGGLGNADWRDDATLLASVVVGLLLLLGSGRDINALALGDEVASGLGVRVPRVHRRLLLAAALMSATAVAAAGIIGFIGLLAPHLMRLLLGRDARALLPAAALGGATLLLACDAIARSALAQVELPVGIVTALLGVPLFLLLARRELE